MQFRLRRLLTVVVILIIVLITAACNMPGYATPTQSGASLIYTAAAQTVQARLTQVSRPGATASGLTPSPRVTSTPPATGEPAATTPAPTAAAVNQTPASEGCHEARFIRDVNIPDGTNVSPGESFEKRWLLENSGTCTWTTDFSLVFTGGDAMGAPQSVPLNEAVPPGERVEVAISFTAPDRAGTYRSEWKLRNAAGQVFGIGKEHRPFWAQVDVVTVSGIVYDFIARASAAEWSSGTNDDLNISLDFNGADDDPNGVAAIKEGVRLENGSTSGKVLLMHPLWKDSGVISGVFPAYTVQPGDRFRARLGFMAPEGSCGEGSVEFEIGVLEDGRVRVLDQFEKSCSRSLLPVDVDLNALRGESVRFVFTVRAAGSEEDDWAIWNSPRIEND